MLMFFPAISYAQRMRNLTGFTKLYWLFTGSVLLGLSIWSMRSIGMLTSSLVIKSINLREFFHYAPGAHSSVARA